MRQLDPEGRLNVGKVIPQEHPPEVMRRSMQRALTNKLVLHRLRAVGILLQGLVVMMDRDIDKALEEGVPQIDIAEALGITKQALFGRVKNRNGTQ